MKAAATSQPHHGSAKRPGSANHTSNSGRRAMYR
jgi:hypothetical protein